jgi:hypothetical protein
MGALAIYGLSKTFYWPTMLAVVGDRFPRSGAVAISCMGGMGMLAAGLLGGPGIGYFKDRYAAEDLQAVNPAAYAEFQAPTTSSFLNFEEVHAIDGGKLGAVQALPDAQRTPTQKAAVAADLSGSRHTLRTVAFVPMIGGYKPVHIGEDKRTVPAAAAA